MKPVVFMDLDGVLADMVRGAFRVHGRSLPMKDVQWEFDKQLGIEPTEFWAAFDYNFWLNLDPLTDGMELLRLVEGLVGIEQIGILTAPCKTPGCRDGKQHWIDLHLPQYSDRVFMGIPKELFAGPTKILIDDRIENAQRFYRAGGWSILPARPWNAARDRCDENGNFDVGYTFGLVEKAVGFITN